ncbi:hypothetical protein FS842_004040 [Serendipita sp. 407]|nr:hypothetical protein FS842_004040 [Serendipita sp. 407]
MEPMNATETHSKVRITLGLSSQVFVAGGEISGKMELDCRTDKGLGINTMMVELVAVQELTSRDHSATSTFISSKRLFQGPNLPPSNAVFAHPQPGAPALPPHYHQARKGCTTFFFNFPIPQSSPNSINFGNGLAKVTYEIRGTVAVFWKGERTSVKSSKEVVVTECLVDSRVSREPSTLVAEGGKMVVQAQVVGGIGVTGKPACVELHVKNHSQKKTTGLTLTLTRTLHLPTLGTSKDPFQITDTIVTVPFRGSEYTIAPGVEGVANLVFDIPRNARGVKGGTREMTDDKEHRHIEALFHVSTLISVAIGMGVGSKEIKIEVPLIILHPLAVPEPYYDPYQAPAPLPAQDYLLSLGPPQPPFALGPHSSGSGSPASYGTPPLQYQHTAIPANVAPYIPQSPPIPVYPYQQYYVPPLQQHTGMAPLEQQYYFPPPPMQLAEYIARPTSAVEQVVPNSFSNSSPVILPPLPAHGSMEGAVAVVGHTEEGKGERASRISLHLKTSSRTRSASPTSHRYRISNVSGNALQTGARGGSATLHETPQRSPEVLSPRPMLSPKASFSGEPLATGGQSGRVAALEKMVEEEERVKRTVPSDQHGPSESNNKLTVPGQQQEELEAAELVAILDKTLPNPPLPSTHLKKEAVHSPKIFEVFNLPPASNKAAETKEELPLTPIAVEGEYTERQKPHSNDTMISPGLQLVGHVEQAKDKEQPRGPIRDKNLPKSPGGLDALEKRLLREVGTRKPPAAVLQKLRELDETTSDAIQEKVKEKQALGVEKRVNLAEGSTAATAAPSEERVEEIHPLLNRRRKKPHDAGQDSNHPEAKKPPTGLTKQEEEAVRLRKAAKGRVAAWLGDAVDADPPPPTETRIVGVTQTSPDSEESSKEEAPKEVAQSAQKADPSKIQLPGRRSSGFMPVSRPLVSPKRTAADHGVEPPSPVPIAKKGAIQQLQAKSGAGYDIRSARGGKGGIVTSVAALWAEKANDDRQAAAPANGVPLPAVIRLGKERVAVPRSQAGGMAAGEPKLFRYSSAALNKVLNGEGDEASGDVSSPTPKPKAAAWARTGLTPARSTPNNLGIKAPSVPAKLSSSIATPLISSTASLARPQVRPSDLSDVSKETDQTNPIPPRVALSPSVSEPRLASKPAASVAFGQGRLKDLIAKYQGNAQS